MSSKQTNKQPIPEFVFKESSLANDIISSLTPDDYNGLMFAEKLTTYFVRRERRDVVGEMKIDMFRTERKGIDCIKVEASVTGVQSEVQGVEPVPCSMELEAFVTLGLRTLYQRTVDSLKQKPYPVEDIAVLEYIDSTDEYVLKRSIQRKGQKTDKEPVKFPRAKLEHLLTEGGAMVLQRLFSAKRLEKFERLVQRAEQRERAFARTRAHAREDAVLESARSETAADGIAAPASAPPAPASTSASASLPAPVPAPVTAAPSALSRRGLENERSGVITDIDLRFLAFDQDYNLAEFSYKYLGGKLQMIGDEVNDGVRVYGFERTLVSQFTLPITVQFFFLTDGHLTNRIQLHSPLVMRVDLMPEPAMPDVYMPEPEVTSPILNWEDDLEMWSRFLERKDELKADYSLYMRRHPELSALVADFLQQLLLRRPADPVAFAREHFAAFGAATPRRPLSASGTGSPRRLTSGLGAAASSSAEDEFED